MFHKFNKRGYKNIKRNENKKIKIINNIKKPRFNIQKRIYSFKFRIFNILIIGIIILVMILIIINKERIVNIFSKKNTYKIININYNLESHYYSRGKTLDRGLPYIHNCLRGNLTNNPKDFKYVENPRISAIVPVYNCEKTLKSSIRSIQNQDMLDIEIILVNDNAGEKTLQIMESLKSEDPRIKIINNNKRRGQFYCRNIGAIECKGEYIVNLDSDDMYVDSDVFETIYHSIKEGNFDILAFKMFEAYSYTNPHNIREHIFNYRPHNLRIFQPRLSCYAISTDGRESLNDLNIWGKLYKTSIYRKAIDALGKERANYFAVHIEDYLMLHLLCNIASSFKFIRKYGLFHKVSPKSNSNLIIRQERTFGELFFAEVIFDFGKPECIQISAKRFYRLAGRYKKANEENKNYYIKLYKKILNSSDIKDKYKERIRDSFKNFTPFNTTDFIKYL